MPAVEFIAQQLYFTFKRHIEGQAPQHVTMLVEWEELEPWVKAAWIETAREAASMAQDAAKAAVKMDRASRSK